MGEAVRLPSGTVTLEAAVDAFLDYQDLARSTRRVYGASLATLVAELGPGTAVAELSSPRVTDWFRARYRIAAPATWNRELAEQGQMWLVDFDRAEAAASQPLLDRDRATLLHALDGVADPAQVRATAEQALDQDTVERLLPPDGSTPAAPVQAARGS